ncbi:Exodeoxyribonuclease VII small subunit [Rhodoferax ferrireducens T118]|uniref:Exodeoxyribonuclease 7 small subunit n=2 Tax=Rhodoferax ferrireducens TaxID=192843 RepID=Q21UG5_ALBFT|nr:Exodeoxyribonuclease VII small subunit [Rhodoferax ferrireducens T118]
MTKSLKSRFFLRNFPDCMASTPKTVSTTPASFEAAQEELEQLVARLESGDLPLDQLLSQYQRGAELLKFCRDRLEAVESQIKVLDQGTLKTWTPE